MFAYFRGELIEASPDEAVIETSGVAYSLLVSAATYKRLPEPGSAVRLLVHLHVKEDLLQLYGFFDEEERQLFRLLLSTSGVGPKLALAILSGLQVHEVQQAIVSNVPERLYGIPGVGKKTAARIILELRDRILRLQPARSGKTAAVVPDMSLRDDAVNALMTLGFSRAVAQKAVLGSLESMTEPRVEELVRESLLAIRNS